MNLAENKIKFSVLMSIYNNEKVEYFNKSMQSIWYDQSYKPDQIVLIQDGPINSDLQTAINFWKYTIGEILHCVVLDKNNGLGFALNIGLDYCEYDLVARMDTDDISFPDRFEKQILFFQANDIDILGGYCIEIDNFDTKGFMRKMPLSNNKIYDMLFACPFIHPSVMFKKSSIQKVGGYNTNLSRRQDYELWFRCAKFGLKFANLDSPLIFYRFTQNTHKKQNLHSMILQGKIGFNGVIQLKQPIWKALACYIPLVRSLLPFKIQHFVYKFFKKIDPRQS